MSFNIFGNNNKLNFKGVKLHRKKNLGKAFKYYRRVLEKQPPREPSENERQKILNFAPILFTTSNEPFPLKDAIAIMHPKTPIIAYHLFWEDDIDYPIDQEPCDHEIIWVLLNESGENIEALFTYFHGKVIKQEYFKDSTNNSHPIIYIQWGKHGSLFQGWEQFNNKEILYYMKSTFHRLKNDGAKNKEVPLAKRWQSFFKGNWNDFIDFSNKIEVEGYLKKNEMLIIGLYANAIIKWYFLHYNFNPKYSWPKLNSPGKGIW